jgi:uncharacterized protein YndB with AHSA1/START domain
VRWEPTVTETAPVEVSMHVAALPGDLFCYFTDPARYAQWMGSEAVLEPVPGGEYRVRMADGFAAAGSFVAVEAPHRVVFTWGFADDEAAARTKHEPGETAGAGDGADASGGAGDRADASDGAGDGADASNGTGASAMPAGSTRVTVTLEAEDGGTRLTLRHENLPSAELRHGHDVAWNVYMPRLAIRAAGGDPGPDPHS